MFSFREILIALTKPLVDLESPVEKVRRSTRCCAIMSPRFVVRFNILIEVVSWANTGIKKTTVICAISSQCNGKRLNAAKCNS